MGSIYYRKLKAVKYVIEEQDDLNLKPNTQEFVLGYYDTIEQARTANPTVTVIHFFEVYMSQEELNAHNNMQAYIDQVDQA